jgi:hypothetical protein
VQEGVPNRTNHQCKFHVNLRSSDVLLAQVVVKVVNTGGAEAVTLAVAIVGVVLSSAALMWQWFSYRLGGPRLRVELKKGYAGVGQLVSSPVNVEADAQMAAQGLNEKLLGVEVKNVGRLPISIDSAVARAENGASFSNPGLPLNPEQGFRLEPSSSASWWVSWNAVRAMISATAAVKPEWNRPQKVWMVVRPAAGKDVKTKQHLIVSPS